VVVRSSKTAGAGGRRAFGVALLGEGRRHVDQYPAAIAGAQRGDAMVGGVCSDAVAPTAQPPATQYDDLHS
jgi:hypothetical protein